MPGRGPGGAGRRGARRRLSRSAEFDRVFREGRSHASRYLVLHVFPRAHAPAGEASADPAASAPGDDGAPAAADPSAAGSARAGDGRAEDGPRLGVSVGRKVGGAVERNRVKRVLREAFWRLAGDLPPDRDVVIVARAEAAELARRGGEPAVEEELRGLLAEAKLVGGEAPR